MILYTLVQRKHNSPNHRLLGAAHGSPSGAFLRIFPNPSLLPDFFLFFVVRNATNEPDSIFLLCFPPLFTATHCGSAGFVFCKSCSARALAPIFCHPIAGPFVQPHLTHICFSAPHRSTAHVICLCHTTCSTVHHMSRADWLTCRISSTSSSSAIGNRQPFLFRAGMYRPP